MAYLPNGVVFNLLQLSAFSKGLRVIAMTFAITLSCSSPSSHVWTLNASQTAPVPFGQGLKARQALRNYGLLAMSKC